MAAMLVEERVARMDGMKVAWLVVGMDDSSVALLVLPKGVMKADQLVESKVETMAAMWVEERVTGTVEIKVAWWVV